MNIETLPADVPTERLILGSVILYEEQLHGIRNLLSEEDFSLEPHRILWRTICGMYDIGASVDRVTILNALKSSGDLDKAGGIGYVVSHDDGLPEIISLDAYCQILKDASLRRRIIRMAEHIQQRCISPGEPLETLLEAMREGLTDLSMPENGGGPVTVRRMVEQHGVEHLLAPRRGRGLKLPWSELDALLCGLHSDQMILVAAHTSYGKTSFALQVATAALEQGKGVLIFSREMSKKQLLRRMVNQIARVDYGVQRQGFSDPSTRARELAALDWLQSAPIHLDEDAATIPAMHAAIRQVMARGRLGLVVVDYLQLIRAVGRVESRAKEVGGNSRALKMAAKEFHVPFLVLSQFSRDSAKDGRQPEIYDLKESGDVENDSDVVMLIRPEDPKSDLDVRPVKVFVAKQREGPRNKEVPMLFFSKNQRFEQESDR